MPEKIVKDGVEIEVFTQIEVEAKAAEAAKNHPDFLKAQADLKVKEDELVKLQNKDTNFANLRQKAEAAEKERDEVKAKLADAVNTIKTDVLVGMLEDVKNTSFNELSGGDEELKKKIEFHYARLGDKVTNKLELDKKVLDAYRLATEYKQPVINSSVMSSSGAGRINVGQKHKFNSDEMELAKKLGISEADLNKHSK